jgi:DNA polymerase-3 subunit epsilon
VFENTDLLFEDVNKAVMFSDILPDLQVVVDSHDAITAYNKKFDFSFLTANGLKITKEYPCPMLAAAPICKIPNKWGNGYKWPTVEEAWDHFFPGDEYVELHRGLDDAMHEAKILYELIKIKAI